ncbi:MAG: hypothetical protein PHX82_08425, partial [Paracoccaceae bacterium]|nr:hypothetical protein [Paracoccaceae bacterium]
IIDDGLWQRVKARQGAIREEIIDARDEVSAAPRSEAGRRASYLLSGLLTCGCCGAGCRPIPSPATRLAGGSVDRSGRIGGQAGLI